MATSTTSVSLETKDNGVPTGQRLWPLTDDTCVLRERLPNGQKEYLDPAEEVIIVGIRKLDMTQSPATFASFDHNNQRHTCVEGIMQLVLAAICRAQQQLYDTKKDAQTHAHNPISVYLEMVYEKPASQLHEAPDYDTTQKKALADFLEEIYGPERVDAQRLMAGARSESGSALLGSADTTNIKFMQTHDDKQIGEMRLWIFMREKTVTVVESICRILEDVKTLYQANVSAGYVSVAGDEKKQKARIAKVDTTTFLANLDEGEFYRSFFNEGRWMEALAHYTQNPNMRALSTQDHSYSTKEPITNANNPLNPGKTFSAAAYFGDKSRMKRLDPQQCEMRNYRASGNRWQFPYPNSVLRVPPTLWDPKRFRQLYTPQYQKHRVEPRLIRQPGRHNNVRDGIEHCRRLPETSEPGGNSGAVFASFRRGVPPAAPAVDDGETSAAEDLDFSQDASEIMHVGAGVGTISIGTTDADEFGELRPPRRRRVGDADDDDDDNGDAETERTEAPTETGAGGMAEDVAADAPPEPDSLLEPNLLVGEMTWSNLSASGTQSADVSGGANKTEIHTLRALYGHGMARQIAKLPDASQRARETVLMQIRGTEEYLAKCMISSSNVSQPCRAINAWMAAALNDPLGLRPQYMHEPLFVDTEMTLFGASVVREIELYDRCLFIHTTHLELFELRMAVHSGYMFEYDKLRLNILLYGGPATSKSYPILITASLMIAHTARRLTNQSDLADADDEDHHDEVLFYEEMPEDMISANSRKADVVNQFKDQLTRNMHTRARLSRNEQGKYNNKVSSSEKFVVYIVASNLEKGEINTAMFDRFVGKQHVRQERKDCSMIDQQNKAASVVQDRELGLQVARFSHDWRVNQALACHAAKLIGTGLLHEPLAKCFSLIYPVYKAVLQERFAITIAPRVGEQIAIFMRSAIIYHALFWLHYSPVSPFFRTERFSIWQLLAIDPMLKDTEELVYFALDHFKSSFINPNQQAVVEVLREHIVPNRLRDQRSLGGDVYAPFRVRATDTQRTRSAAAVAGAAISAASAQAQGTDAEDPANDHGAPQPATAQTTTAPEQRAAIEQGCNYSYYAFKMTRKKFCSMISSHLRYHECARRLSDSEVEEIMAQMLESRVFSRSFVANPDPTGPLVVLDELSRPEKCAAVRISADGLTIYIHSSLLFGEPVDPHETAIRACMTSNTPVTKYICGKPVSDDLPHLAAVRNVGPNNYTPYVDRLPEFDENGIVRDSADGPAAYSGRSFYEQCLGSDTVSGHTTTSTTRPTPLRRKALLDMSYDDYCTIQRLVQLGIPVDDDNVARFSSLIGSTVAHETPGMTHRRTADYPKYFVESIEAEIARSKQINSTLSQYGKGDLATACTQTHEAPVSASIVARSKRPRTSTASMNFAGKTAALMQKIAADPHNQNGYARARQEEVDRRNKALHDAIRAKADQEKAAAEAAKRTTAATQLASATTTTTTTFRQAHPTSSAPLTQNTDAGRSMLHSSFANLPQPSGTYASKHLLVLDESNGPGITGTDALKLDTYNDRGARRLFASVAHLNDPAQKETERSAPPEDDDPLCADMIEY